MQGGRSCSTSTRRTTRPGCTAESCAFQDNLPKFKSGKAAVLGVSILDEKSKAKFAAKHGLTFPLLADADHAVAEKYGVWQEKSRYGRKYMGIVRTTYLIGPDGKVAKRWDNVKVDGTRGGSAGGGERTLGPRVRRFEGPKVPRRGSRPQPRTLGPSDPRNLRTTSIAVRLTFKFIVAPGRIKTSSR